MVNLRVKNVGGRKYYYLEHTVRLGKRFANKRKYLGRELPKDIERLKEEFMHEFFLERYSKVLTSIQKKFSHDLSAYLPSAKEKYVESFMIKFTYNTNRIEGGTLSLKETADLLQEHITPRNKPVEDVKEAEAHKKAFYEMLNYRKELTLATVLHWHKLLLQDTKPDIAGRVRRNQVAIARSKVELPFPAELDTLLHEFFIWYDKNESRINPVAFAALVHLKFVTIHPFSDGNGRISRLMMNFVLHRHSYPMLSIEYTNRNSYYTALERSQMKYKDHIFVQYIVKRYLKAYERYREMR
ncbi:TPA: Fic family protein [Candidatus Woesearchaeota archaeon]|nr:Fic family protein [Candidatus Woesearchaeota archaeon]